MMREGLSFLRAQDMFGLSNEEGNTLLKECPLTGRPVEKSLPMDTLGYLKTYLGYSLNKCGSI